MRFAATAIAGALVVDLQPLTDERGLFARTWCAREFAARGINSTPVQSSLSFSRQRGTLRGLHFQLPPSREGKLLRCVRGALLDVLVDLRCESPDFLKAVTVELTALNRRAVFVPPGVAHGFQTLLDDTEVHYQMNDEYRSDLSSGVRWDDPAFGIRWPITPPILMSDRDRQYPDFDANRFTAFRGY
ncbi:MAG: dTDP-4-dehydrorhamnose 3,5-epimerase [Gammaproteobacteria bacterium]